MQYVMMYSNLLALKLFIVSDRIQKVSGRGGGDDRRLPPLASTSLAQKTSGTLLLMYWVG